jgi:hypothetical protein
MPTTLSQFISNFKGGTRRNRFLITGTWPAGSVNATTTFHILTANLPASNLGMVTVPWRGREINFAGDRQYDPWEIIVLDDTGANVNLWKSFHQWQKSINDHRSNTHTASNDAFNTLKTDWRVQHLNLNGSVIKTMLLKGCWPALVGPVQFNMKENTFNTFAVRMNYDYYTGV